MLLSWSNQTSIGNSANLTINQIYEWLVANKMSLNTNNTIHVIISNAVLNRVHETKIFCHIQGFIPQAMLQAFPFKPMAFIPIMHQFLCFACPIFHLQAFTHWINPPSPVVLPYDFPFTSPHTIFHFSNYIISHSSVWLKYRRTLSSIPSSFFST